MVQAGIRGFFFDEEDFRNAKEINTAATPKKREEKSKGKRLSSAGSVGCDFCDLQRHCLTPKMVPYGENKLDVLIVGEAPGKNEDIKGRPFIGKAGRTLRWGFKEYDIDIDVDCLTTNVIQCRPSGNKFPGIKYIRHCAPRLKEQIEEAQPRLIYAFGMHAITGILLDVPKRVKAAMENLGTGFVGKVVPSQLWGCWVVCCYHPSYVDRVERKELDDLFIGQIGQGWEYYDKEIPVVLDHEIEKI